MSQAAVLKVEVFFDLICPWCLIGKRHFDDALAQLMAATRDVTVDVTWRSWPLMPEVPLEGLPFAEFYRCRLGGPEAMAMRQAQVRGAARAAGVEIDFDRIAVFPNTLAAHRLIASASARHGKQLVPALIAALFDHYFRLGADIGDADVLARIASACGVDRVAADVARVASGAVRAASAPDRHVRGVPHFRFDDHVIVQGAQPASTLLAAMRRALAASAAQA